MTEDWYDLYSDGDYDLAVMDEFKGHKPLTWMHEWCQGFMMYLKRRGISGYIKQKQIPTIIISNYTPQDCYQQALEKHSDALEPLLRRIEVVEVTEKIQVLYNQ